MAHVLCKDQRETAGPDNGLYVGTAVVPLQPWLLPNTPTKKPGGERLHNRLWACTPFSTADSACAQLPSKGVLSQPAWQAHASPR